MSNRSREILFALFLVLVAVSMKSHGCALSLGFPVTLR